MTIDIKALRELCERRESRDPWEAYSAMCCPDMGGIDSGGRRTCHASVGKVGHPMTLVDAELAAAAVNALPALLDLVAAKDAEIERLRGLLKEARCSMAAAGVAESLGTCSGSVHHPPTKDCPHGCYREWGHSYDECALGADIAARIDAALKERT